MRGQSVLPPAFFHFSMGFSQAEKAKNGSCQFILFRIVHPEILGYQSSLLFRKPANFIIFVDAK